MPRRRLEQVWIEPRIKALIRREAERDGRHMSQKATQLLEERFRELGYDVPEYAREVMGDDLAG